MFEVIVTEHSGRCSDFACIPASLSTHDKLLITTIDEKYVTTRNQYASPPEGNAIPAGHVQKRLSLNLVSLRDRGLLASIPYFFS